MFRLYDGAPCVRPAQLRFPVPALGPADHDDDLLARHQTRGPLQRSLQQRRTAVEWTILLRGSIAITISAENAGASAVAVGQNDCPYRTLFIFHRDSLGNSRSCWS